MHGEYFCHCIHLSTKFVTASLCFIYLEGRGGEGLISSAWGFGPFHTALSNTFFFRTLEDVGASVVDVKVNKGRTEDTSMTVDGAIFSKHPNTKVRVHHL